MKLSSILATTAFVICAAVSAQASEVTDAFKNFCTAINGVTESLKSITDSASADKSAEKVAEKAKVVAVAGKQLEEATKRLATASESEQQTAQKEIMEALPAVQAVAETLGKEVERLKNAGVLYEGSKLDAALKQMNPNPNGI